MERFDTGRARIGLSVGLDYTHSTGRTPGGRDSDGSGAGAGAGHGDDQPVYVISVAAELAGMHPQTLRAYDRLGLVCPSRTAGRGRRYSPRDVRMLREVARMSQQEGINLEGIRRILHLSDQVAVLQARLHEMEDELARARREADERVAEALRSTRRELVRVTADKSVVLWRRPPS